MTSGREKQSSATRPIQQTASLLRSTPLNQWQTQWGAEMKLFFNFI